MATAGGSVAALSSMGVSVTAGSATVAMAKAVLTVGVTANLDKFLGQTLKIDTSDTATIGDKFTRAFVQGTGLALTNTLVYGESPEAFLKKHLTNQLVDTAASGLYTYGVKPLDVNDTGFISNITHKLGAGLTGCLSATAKKQDCKAGAIALLYDFDVDTAVRRWRIMLFTLIRVKRSKWIRIKQMR